MARLYLLIDGYNLLHAVGPTKNRRAGDTERNRYQLLQQLYERLNPALHGDTIVVFDGIEDEKRPQSRTMGSISIRFAGTASDADSEIERLLASHSSPKQVLIVSSDHRLHKAARRRRATAIDSDAFWDLIEDSDANELQSSIDLLRNRTRALDTSKPDDPHEIELPDDFLDFDSR